MLQSVQRGVLVLELLTASDEPLSARAIAESVGLDRTVTHRILRTLELEALVVEERGRYALGPRNLVFGNSYVRRHPLRLAGLPYQIDLLYRSYPDQPWALTLLMRVGRRLTLVSQIWSPTAPLDSLLAVGDVPIDEAASGRCILAFLSPPEVVGLVGAARAKALTSRLALIRSAGGVDVVGPEDRSSQPPGLLAVAALIRTRSGIPVAGLTMSGNGLEGHLDRQSPLASRLLRTAGQIGELLV